jgi:hypothetical protein
LNVPGSLDEGSQKETVIAEKFHAMVALGVTNSRVKDFFDIAWLAEHFAFDEARLGDAIRATFVRRTTPIPRALPLALSGEFYGDATKQAQWRAFVRRINRAEEPSLAGTVERIAAFLLPFVNDDRRGRAWAPGGPWGQA